MTGVNYCSRPAFAYGRNLQTIAVGRRQWDVHLSMRGEAGSSYVIALSATGTAPGIPLLDGRRIPLAADAVTYTTLGGLAPFFNGNLGQLGGAERAVARIDVRTLPPAANGVRIWIAALTYNSRGIKTIVDTKVLKLEGL